MSTETTASEDAETIIVECLDVRGRMQFRERFALNGESLKLSAGRSVNADITLDDEHAAAVHALLEITSAGRILASDLGSANGIVIGGVRHHKIAQFELPGNELQIGRSRLRIRTAHETLAPEKADHFAATSLLSDPAWLAGAGAAAAGAQLFYASWLGAPRDLAANAMTMVFGGAVLLGAWIAVWALLSRIMRGEWRWRRNAAICFGIVAISNAVDGIIDLGWFMFSLPPAASRSIYIGALALGAAVCLHLMNASTLSRRRAAQIAVTVTVLLLSMNYWALQRPQERNVNYIDSALRIYPPALRLKAASEASDYFKDLAGLRLEADQKLQSMLSRFPDLADDTGDED